MVDPSVNRTAALGFERVVAGKAGIAAERFVERRLFESLAVRKTDTSVAPEPGAIAESKNSSRAGDYASAERRVVFGANAGAEREARNRKPAGVEESRLIIAARVLTRKSARKSVFYFIFIASRNGAGAKRISRLLAKTRAVELVDAGKKGRVRIGIERAIFMTA